MTIEIAKGEKRIFVRVAYDVELRAWTVSTDEANNDTTWPEFGTSKRVDFRALAGTGPSIEGAVESYVSSLLRISR